MTKQNNNKVWISMLVAACALCMCSAEKACWIFKGKLYCAEHGDDIIVNVKPDNKNFPELKKGASTVMAGAGGASATDGEKACWMYKGKLYCIEHGDDIVVEKPSG